MAAERKRILLAEDHEIVGQGLKALLSPYFDIVGPVRNGLEVLPTVASELPDAVVLDISMPGRNGLDVLPDLVKAFPRLPVVMLTGSADIVVCRTALLLGAMGFLPKDSGVDELELALRTVFHGRQYLSPRLPASLDPDSPTLPPLPPAWSHLTPRQIRILRLIGEGKSDAGLQDALGVSADTLTIHRRNLRKILGVDSDAGLLRIAVLLHVREEFPAR